MSNRRILKQMRLPLGFTTLAAAAFREMLKDAPHQPKANKYGAIRTQTPDGKEFDSRREAARYLELKRIEQAGEIRGLQCQVPFDLVVNGISCGKYVSDFRYVVCATGEEVVEDVKGGKATKTRLWRLKVKLVGAIYGIKIKEVM